MKKPLFDPFAAWKGIYDKTEEKWSEIIHETMMTEAYSEWMGYVQNGYLQYQDMIQKSAEAYLKQVNMPTRSEVASVASLIINLEDKVDNLEQKIEDELLVDQFDEINKLKASITKLDKKMDEILKAVQQTAKQTPAAPPVAPVENK